LPGRNCARVFLQAQRSPWQSLAEAGRSLGGAAKSVFGLF
jgi:hypothetical protein